MLFRSVSQSRYGSETLKRYEFIEVDESRTYREYIKDIPRWLEEIISKFYEGIKKGEVKQTEKEEDEITNEFKINELYNNVGSKMSKEKIEEIKGVELDDESIRRFIIHTDIIKGVSIESKIVEFKKTIMEKIINSGDNEILEIVVGKMNIEVFIRDKTVIE